MVLVTIKLLNFQIEKLNLHTIKIVKIESLNFQVKKINPQTLIKQVKP